MNRLKRRIEKIEKRLEAKKEMILVPDYIFGGSGQFIKVPKDFFWQILQLLD